MNPDNMHDLVIVVGAIVFLKATEYIVGYIAKRITGDQYVTKKDCESCKKEDANTTSRLTSEISVIKGILLVLAVRGGIPPEELKNLTQ